MLQQIVKQAWHQLDVGDLPTPRSAKLGPKLLKGMKEELKKEPL